jgi:hypothetical protein
MKKLLHAGIIGPLSFIALFFVEGFTRSGYSQWRNLSPGRCRRRHRHAHRSRPAGRLQEDR